MPRRKPDIAVSSLRCVSRRGGALHLSVAMAAALSASAIASSACASPNGSAGSIGSFERLSSLAIGVSAPLHNGAPRSDTSAAPAPVPAPARWSAQSQSDDPSALCDAAVARAAAKHGAPERLLRSIALVESGRTRNGERRAWPWTVNMEGEGRWFDSRDEALAFVRARQAKGAKSFDLGCLQVNHYWHGKAFDSLEAMIDPAANADYAARYLSGLAAETGDWMRAAGYYHSRNPKPFARYSALIADAYDSAAARQLPPITALRADSDGAASSSDGASRLALLTSEKAANPAAPRYRGLLRLAAPVPPPARGAQPNSRSILDGLPPARAATAPVSPGGIGLGAFAASDAQPLLTSAGRPLFGAAPRDLAK